MRFRQVGPNYDEMEISDVRMMDLTTISNMVNPQAAEVLDQPDPVGMSPFQKRMKARPSLFARGII